MPPCSPEIVTTDTFPPILLTFAANESVLLTRLTTVSPYEAYSLKGLWPGCSNSILYKKSEAAASLSLSSLLCICLPYSRLRAINKLMKLFLVLLNIRYKHRHTTYALAPEQAVHREPELLDALSVKLDSLIPKG